MRHIAVIGTIGLALAVGVGSALAEPPPGQQEKTVVTNPPGVIRAVEATSDAGFVTVVPGRKASVTAELRWVFQEPKLTVTVSKGVLRVDLECADNPGAPNIRIGGAGLFCSGDLTLVVPAKVDLTVRAEFGDVTASNLSGAIEVTSGYGSVAATDVRGPRLRAGSGNGNVLVRSVSSSEVIASSSSGSVRAEKISAARTLTATSGNGDVDLVSVRSPALKVSSSSGSVSVSGSTSSRLKASSGNGNVVLERVTSPVVEASSSSGRVRMSRVTATEIDAGSGNGNVDLAAISARRIDASSQSGSVNIAAERTPDLVEATSGNGNVAVVVPAGRYAVEARSGNGRVSIDRLTVDSRAPRRIVASSSSGNVTVEGR